MLVSRISPAPRSTPSRAQCDRVAAGRRPATGDERLPARPRRDLASIASTTHCAPNVAASSSSSSGRASAAELTDTLSAPASSTAWASATERMPPPIVNGMNTSSAVRRASSTTVVSLVRGRGDVEEHELVRPRGVVATGQLDRIAGVAQVDEPDALDHAAAVDVEAWDHALVVHQRSSTACASPTVNRPSYRALPTITARRLTWRSSTSARRSSSEETPPEYA